MDILVAELLIKMLVENKLDRLKFGDIEIVKTKYDPPKSEPKPENKQLNKKPFMDEDEILFWSSSSPNLTQQQIEDFAVNPAPPLGKKPRKSKDKLNG